MTIEKWILTELINYAKYLTLSVVDAEDLLQDASLRFYSNDEYLKQPISKQKALLLTIIKRIYIDNIRRRKISGRLKQQYYSIVGERNSFCEQNIDLKSLQMYMTERNDKQINIFHLHNIGYPVRELADIFNMTEGGICGSIYKGKHKLIKRFMAA